MASGGARPGSGRKSNAEKYARPIAEAEKKFADRLPSVAGALLDLALGVVVEEMDKEGEVTVYQRPPDRAACEAVLSRIMGKPTERQEISGEGGGPFKIQITPEITDYRKAAAPLKPPD